MNRIFTVIICAFLLLSLSSCSSKDKKEDPSSIASPGIVESNFVAPDDKDPSEVSKKENNDNESKS